MWNEVCDIYSPDAELDNESKLYEYKILENYDWDYSINKYTGIVIANTEDEAIDKALKDCGVVYGSAEVEEISEIDGYKIKLEKIK